jgi:hypothetical protein
MKQLYRLTRIVASLTICSFMAAGCSGGSSSMGSGGQMSAPPPVAIQSFTSASNTVHIGESTQLTAVFSGDTASIEGIGAVQSGVPVATPALARATTFTLTVRRGSQQAEARVSVGASYRDQFRALAPAPVAYTQHVAIALPDGGALVMGGNTSASLNVPDTDRSHRFDPVTETFAPGPQLAFSAEADLTTPVALSGGGFLLVGPGINSALHLDAGLRATQAFNAATGTFHRAGDLAARHDGGGTSTTLDDGTVLVAGGQFPALAVAERYSPVTEQWNMAASMTTARRGHTATRLADGRVLIAGGLTCCDQTGEVFATSAEIYDPRTNVFQSTGSLSTARGFHAATLLADGRVLVTGGFADTNNATTASAEIYDPSTGRFSAAGNMQAGRSVHSAILLTDGRVLVVGGLQRTTVTDIFDARTGTWAPGPTPAPAVAATATLLRNGKVLIFGGEGASGFPISTVMIFE